MSEAEVEAIVDRLADIAAVLHDANPHDKAEVFRQLGLKLTYHPGRKIVEARVEPRGVWVFRWCPRTEAYQLHTLAVSR
jgi:hypothetical protein